MMEEQLQAQAVRWGQPVKGLKLGLTVSGTVVHLHLENVTEDSLEVLSYVQAQEKQYDWYKLTLTDAHGKERQIRLFGMRRESSEVRVQLAPHRGLAHPVDVVTWAARPINGGEPLASGDYKVSAVYEVPPGAGHWSGRLEAGPVTQSIP